MAKWCSASRWILTLSLFLPFLLPLFAVLYEIHAPEFHSPIRRKGRGPDGVSAFGGHVHDFCNFDRLWCCNASASTGGVLFPTTIEEVQAIVSASSNTNKHSLIRVIGAGHSMSPIVCSEKTHNMHGRHRDVILISLDNLAGDVTITKLDSAPAGGAMKSVGPPSVAAIAHAPGGMRLKQLNEKLWDEGYSLFNTGMIAEQSLGGVISTSVHGTGFLNTAINHRVVSMDVVLANGTVATFSASKHPELFKHSRMHLGLFGVVVGVSIEVRERFYVRRREQLTDGDTALIDAVLLSEDKIEQRKKIYAEKKTRADADSSSSSSFFLSHPMRAQAWWFSNAQKSLVQDLSDEIEYSSLLSDAERDAMIRPSWMRRAEIYVNDIFMLVFTSLSVHVPVLTPLIHKVIVLSHSSPRDFTSRSYEAFTHPGTNFHSVRYSETELFVPANRAAAAYVEYKRFLKKHMEATAEEKMALEATNDYCDMNAIAPLRTIAADDIPLSPATAAIHAAVGGTEASSTAFVAFSFTMVYRRNFDRCAAQLQTLLQPFGGRPHFGKRYGPLLAKKKDVVAMYGKESVESFTQAVLSVDPKGLFRLRDLEVLFFETERAG